MCWTAFIIKNEWDFFVCACFVSSSCSLSHSFPLALIYLNCVLKVFLFKQRLRGWHMKVSHNINLLCAARWKISYSCCSEGASHFHIPTLNYVEVSGYSVPLHFRKARTQSTSSSQNTRGWIIINDTSSERAGQGKKPPLICYQTPLQVP